MLIEFTVENYRSIKEPVTLSTVATGGKRLTAKSSKRRNIKLDNEIASPFRDEGRNLELLPVIGIFGANASGKSTVLQALDSLLLFIHVGAITEKSNLRWRIPFRLTEKTSKSPTRFELRVLQKGIIFTYTLVVDNTSILHERLDYIPAASRRVQNRLLFLRTWHENKKAYVYSNGKDFGNAYIEIQNSVREIEPFMSLLVTRLNVPIVEPFVSWLRLRWGGVALGAEQTDHKFATKLLEKHTPEKLGLVTQIIRRFDTGITDIEIEKVEADQIKEDEEFNVWVLHGGDAQQIRWPLEHESTGTQRLFSLAYKILFAFEFGGLLLIDELGSNIHPNITRVIVRMFQSEKLNPKRAQLIFTSHDNTLQRGNLLRRDQIWFTQKRADGSTELYSLSDFRPRNDLAIDKAYLDGRFGAIPILPDEEEMLEPVELGK